MNRATYILCAALLLTGGCGAGSEPEIATAAETSPKSDGAPARTSKVQSPVQIDYRVIGTPIVGQPVAVELQLTSRLGSEPYKISLRVNDPTAMQLQQSQAASLSIAPTPGDERTSQQVTVIPLREGRVYLNVAAVIETESGSMQTVTAIPIQVGPVSAREIIENGSVTTDEEGNLIRSLPASEN